jgi:hypothetical protein
MGIDAATMTASDRTWRRFAAPILLPEWATTRRSVGSHRSLPRAAASSGSEGRPPSSRGVTRALQYGHAISAVLARQRLRPVGYGCRSDPALLYARQPSGVPSSPLCRLRGGQHHQPNPADLAGQLGQRTRNGPAW